MYKNDIYLLELFNKLLYLKSSGGAEKMKEKIQEIFQSESNHKKFNQSDIEFGYSLFNNSISNWHVVFKQGG